MKCVRLFEDESLEENSIRALVLMKKDAYFRCKPEQLLLKRQRRN